MKKACVAIVIAALLILPTAAAARGGHGYGHRGYSSSIHLSSSGDVAVGILLGGLAVALATRPYRYPSYGYRYPSYGYVYPSYGYRSDYRYSGYGYRRDYRYPRYGYRRYYQPTYAPPPPPRYVQHRNCSPIQGNGTYHGRPARFGGTHCYDRYGNGYVVPGSAQFIYYLR